jgi:type VI secretion system FHA domain protein
MTITLHFQSTGTIPENAQPFKMLGRNMTVGRGEQNDLILPDAEKIISSKHFIIEDHGGNIVVVDLSTNGTFLNYGKVALGAIPTPLNDGDILTLGGYELLVEIPSAKTTNPLDDLPEPEGIIPVSFGQADASESIASVLDNPDGEVDFLDDLLSDKGSSDGPAGVVRDQLGDDGLMPPLGQDENDLSEPVETANDMQTADRSSVADHFQTPVSHAPKMTIPEDWSDNFLEGIEPSTEDLPSKIEPANDVKEIEPELEKTQIPATLIKSQAVKSVDASEKTDRMADQYASQAFLQALGANELNISEDELTPTFSRMGHVLRVMIHGMREILMTRTSIKSEFRINQTMISAGGNNPLKFSISPEQAVETMVKQTTKGYLDSVDAAEQALQDIKAHEIAMITGMEAALKGVLRRLDPAELESQMQSSGGITSVLKGKKARYWDIYEKMYSEISDQAENDFHELFSKEFARAYQDQLERLK